MRWLIEEFHLHSLAWQRERIGLQICQIIDGGGRRDELTEMQRTRIECSERSEAILVDRAARRPAIFGLFRRRSGYISVIGEKLTQEPSCLQFSGDSGVSTEPLVADISRFSDKT